MKPPPEHVFCDDCDGSGWWTIVGQRLTGGEFEKVPCRACDGWGHKKIAEVLDVRRD